MKEKHFKTKIRKGIPLIILSFIITIPLLLQVEQTKFNAEETFGMVTSDSNNPIDAGKTELKLSPYFGNITPIMDWMALNILANETTDSSSLFFSTSNRNGSQIIDDRIYFEDFVVMLDGLVAVLGVNQLFQLSAYFQEQYKHDLWDTNSTTPTNGAYSGFYTWLNGTDLSTNSTTKDSMSNAQAIRTFVDYMITEEPGLNSYEVPEIIETQWNVLDNCLYDSDYGMYNHTTADSSKYIADQLVIAIDGFLTHRMNDEYYDNSLKTEKNNTATIIMEKLVNPGYNIYTDNTFIQSRNYKLQLGTGITDKYLATNAYGIQALLEWYVEGGGLEDDYYRVEYAESTFQALNNSLWNSTYGLFMNTASSDNSAILDSKINLKDNAIMMSALTRLFEVTANFTYLSTAIDMFYSIQEFFRDEIYGTYFTSIDTLDIVENNIIDTNKSLGAHAYLFRALNELDLESENLQTEIATNNSIYIKEEMTELNLTMKYYFDLTLNHSESGTLISNRAGVSESTMFYAIRYPNGTVLSTATVESDSSGNYSTIIPLDIEYPIGEYEISYYANYSGLLTRFNSTTFSIGSGIIFADYSFENGNEFYAGETFNLNLTLNSSREAEKSFTLVFEGEQIVQSQNSGIEIINNTLNNYTFSVSTKSDSDFGAAVIELKIYDGDILYDARNISISIYSSVEVLTIISEKNGFRNESSTLEMNLNNLMNISEDVDIDIYGDYISFVKQNLTINANAKPLLDYSFLVSSDAPISTIQYTVNLTRSSDDAQIFSQTFNLEIKQKVEIQKISTPSEISHFDSAYATILVINNKAVEHSIIINVKDESGNIILSSPYDLISGENELQVQLGHQINNPYQLGLLQFEIEIVSESEVIHSDFVELSLIQSFGSLFIGFILPILVPLAVLVVVKHISQENKKRLV